MKESIKLKEKYGDIIVTVIIGINVIGMFLSLFIPNVKATNEQREEYTLKMSELIENPIIINELESEEAEPSWFELNYDYYIKFIDDDLNRYNVILKTDIKDRNYEINDGTNKELILNPELYYVKVTSKDNKYYYIFDKKIIRDDVYEEK